MFNLFVCLFVYIIRMYIQTCFFVVVENRLFELIQKNTISVDVCVCVQKETTTATIQRICLYFCVNSLFRQTNWCICLYQLRKKEEITQRQTWVRKVRYTGNSWDKREKREKKNHKINCFIIIISFVTNEKNSIVCHTTHIQIEIRRSILSFCFCVVILSSFAIAHFYLGFLHAEYMFNFHRFCLTVIMLSSVLVHSVCAKFIAFKRQFYWKWCSIFI